MSTLVTVAAYAAAHGKSERQVQRYVKSGRLTVVEVDGVRLIPADATPSSADVATVSPTSPGVGPAVIPPGLWELDDVAAFYRTTPRRIRVMGEHPRSPFVVGRFGPPDVHGRATWRVWVF